jgi:hypothetical protein
LKIKKNLEKNIFNLILIVEGILFEKIGLPKYYFEFIYFSYASITSKEILPK